MPSVLFVCLGNICRSPLAEGVFRHTVAAAGLEDRFIIDSAGTGGWHQGNPPDPRSVGIAAQYGIDISNLRARQVTQNDANRFDLILAMDLDNLTNLRRIPNSENTRLFLTAPDREVPDPYYGGPNGFETVYRMVKDGCLSLLDELMQN